MDYVNRAQLTEAYYIEKIAMYFAGKMLVQADSIEQRQFYCSMAEDEARHYRLFESLIGIDLLPLEKLPFIQFLDRIVRESDKPVATFLVQVVLEGWGLHHYQQLARYTTSVDLKDQLHRLLRDEAQHHSAGKIIFNELRLNPYQVLQLEEAISEVLAMVRCGPVVLLDAIESVTGPLTRTSKTGIMDSINAQESIELKVQLLSRLIGSETMLRRFMALDKSAQKLKANTLEDAL